MTTLLRLAAAFALLATLAGASVAPASAQSAGTFRFEKEFLGRTVAFGRFRTITGVDRRFRVDLNGTWNGRTLKLVERFRFDDGERDTKIWYFTKTGPGRYTGRRSDVDGVAKVRVRGNVARYGYRLFLNEKERSNAVYFRDRMVKRADGTILNTALVFKGPLPVGRVKVVFGRPKDVGRLERP